MDNQATMTVGVVVERRDSDSRWVDHVWAPVAVIPNPPDVGEPWHELRKGDGWAHFLARTLTLEIFRGETEGYRENLQQPRPAVFVVLRQGEEREDNDVEPFRVTVCPHEAMGYIESGDEIVEGVPMPDEVTTWLQSFVDHHHVDEPFRKRKNKRQGGEPEFTRPRGRHTRTGS